MSSRITSTPTFAKWHAMREPITPEPNTATFFITLCIALNYLLKPTQRNCEKQKGFYVTTRNYFIESNDFA